MKKILVTGGCGYIGSHTIIDLIDNGYEVISVDSNIRSNENMLDAIKEITGVAVQNYKVDLCDLEATRAIFKDHSDINGIIHFAAFKSVAESTSAPLLYFRNNNNSLVNILECVKEFKVKNFIFSSSCSVYGNIEKLPVNEDTVLGEAQSPYARTKQIGEFIVKDFSIANPNCTSILLRYFNPAGAHESGKIGEVSFGRPIYLVPVITDTAVGKRESFTVYGNDYDTRDGSCVRDFIHIMDLAGAHTKALEYAESGNMEGNCDVFNLGIGDGVTVLEMVYAFEKVTGIKLNYNLGERRPGDVVAIYCNYVKAAEKLKWKPTRNVEDIMRTAWAWEQTQV